MMEQARAGFQPMVNTDLQRKIGRLVAFIDGVIDKEEDAKRHPLATAIQNWAPWNVTSLAELSDSLTLAAERATGFSRLRRSLGQPEHFDDAATELSLAAEFLRAGLSVSFVMETKDKKTSDLLIEFDERKMYVEITRLGQSAEAKEVFSFSNRESWRVAEFSGLDVEIHLAKFISKPRLKALIETLLTRAAAVRASGDPMSYAADGLLSASIKKTSAGGASSFSVNFPLNVDEIDRLARTIRRKAAQLPEGDPGILVVVDDALHVSPWELPNFSPVVEGVEEYVYEHSRLTGLLVILPFSAAQANAFASHGESWIAWRKIGPVSLFEDRIFIRNRYAERQSDERFLTAIGCPLGDPGESAPSNDS